jgi:hypothetical protein
MSLRQTAAEAKRAIAEPAHWLNELDAVRRDLDDQHTSIHNARVALVDGNLMFSRPGPRLVDAFEFLVAWLHGRPELTPPGFPATPLQREPGTPPSPATRSTAS